jgi:4-hydroxy-2-oxoheptanedioate aldolase
VDANPLKRIWDAGAAAIGTYIMYSRDATTVQLAAAAGLNFVVFDREHRPHDSETIHDLAQVARLAGMAPLVGPADISAHAISHVLDLGASGVVVPHVETREEVELAVQAVRYPPLGRRGKAGMAGHNLYSPSRSTADEVAHYNSDVALLLKVESESAVRNLDELVSPADVDGVMVGPLDLSLDLGIPGETGHERVLELIDHVRDVCRRRGLQYGAHASSAAGVAREIEAGASWVIVGSEMEFLSEAWREASRARDAQRP